jgi:hypothetical protein
VRIFWGLDLREPLHAGGVDLGQALLGLTLGLDLAIAQGALQGDELPFLERAGELREALPGIDAMPFGAGLVLAQGALPALLGCDVEDNVLAVVMRGLASAFCPRRPMRMTLLKMVCLAPLSSDLSPVCGTCWGGGCGAPSPPEATGRNLRKGPQTRFGAGVRTLKGREADSGKESVRPKGGDVFGAAR